VASPDPLSPGPSVFLVDTEETPKKKKTERDPDAPAYAADGDIQLEYSSD
jgi:hypothetical protein